MSSSESEKHVETSGEGMSQITAGSAQVSTTMLPGRPGSYTYTNDAWMKAGKR